MKVLRDVENKLLRRRNVKVLVENDGPTPKRVELKEKIAKAFGVDVNLVIVKKAQTKFGSSDVIVDCKIYDDEEALKRYARPHLVKRNMIKEENSSEGGE